MNDINRLDLTIELTKQCNLNCIYCTQIHLENSINEDIINSIVNYAISKVDPQKINLLLYGGEPFLNAPALLFAMKVAIESGIRSITVITNGTLNNKDIEDYISKMFHQRLSGGSCIG